MVRIKGGSADHRQNVARVRIHGDDGALVPVERLFRSDLHIQVDSQFELLARNRGSLAETSHFFAVTVNQRATLAVSADKNIVVLLLDSGLADNVSLVVKLELLPIEIVFTHFAHIPDQVRSESILRIEPTMHHDRFQLRYLTLISFDEGDFVRCDVRLDDNGF